MLRAILPLALLANLAAPAVCLSPSPLQDAGEPVQAGEAQDTEPVLVPAVGQVGFGNQVEDIDLHRVERLPYVRRQADVVQMALGPADIAADVIMTVDGDPLTRGEFRRRAALYLAMPRVEQVLTRVITNRQRDLYVAEGRDPADFEVTEELIDEKLESLMAVISLQARGPAEADGGSEAADKAEAEARQRFLESIGTSLGMDEYRQMLATDVAFERVYLPMPTEPQGDEIWDIAEKGPVPVDDPKPDWLPQMTWDALASTESFLNLRQFVKTHGAEGKPIPSFFRGQITSSIRSGVLQLLGVRYFFDEEMPDDVLLRVGDVDVRVDEIWPLVAKDIADTDIDLILREELTLQAMRRTLQKVGEWMTDEEAAEAFDELNSQYEGTLFPLSSIIVLRGYNSIDRYREHWRYKECYRLWRKKTLSDAEIEEHYRAGGRLFFERGTAEVDVAYSRIDNDLPFEDARFDEAAATLIDKLGGAEDFRAVAETAFALPATRQSAQSSDPNIDRRFQRNPLRIRLCESDLSVFLAGYSLADEIFYHGVPGEVFGPVPQRCRRHSWGAEMNAGVWMARLSGFQRARALAPLQGKEHNQATEDFLDLNYQFWTQECLKLLLPKVSVTANT